MSLLFTNKYNVCILVVAEEDYGELLRGFLIPHTGI